MIDVDGEIHNAAWLRTGAWDICTRTTHSILVGRMRLTNRLPVVALVLAMISCGGSSSPVAITTGAPIASSPVLMATSSPSPTRSPLNEAAVKAALESSGFGVTSIVVFTAETDPNKFLGRPGQYIGKVSWKDPRAPREDATIEVFPDAASLQARFVYIDAIMKSSPMFLQWMFRNETRLALLRLPKDLTPDQAKEYENWLSKL